MRFTHLPVDGGLYDQHPQLLDDWLVIMDIEVKVEKAKAAKDREGKLGNKFASSRGSGRRRR